VQAGGLQAIRFILGMFEGLNTSGAGLVVRDTILGRAQGLISTDLDVVSQAGARLAYRPGVQHVLVDPERSSFVSQRCTQYVAYID
jgi:hypothetical protein